jgi:molecular chaperone GrpE
MSAMSERDDQDGSDAPPEEDRSVDSVASETPSDEAAAPDPREAAPEEIEAWRARAGLADELEDRIKRLEADFVNESKRMQRRADQERKYAIEKVIIDLLPTLDALHSAAAALGTSDSDNQMRAGLELVHGQLSETLARHGVKPIEAAELAFDPTRHQALYTVPTAEVAPQTVVEVLRPGFMLHDRVVRPAEVSVSVALPPAGDDAPREDE